MTSGSQIGVRDALPELAAELATALHAQGRADLAAQLGSLPLVARCRCGEELWGMFYTVAPPKGSWGPGHENVVVEGVAGLVILDVVDDRIVAVEILGRQDVMDQLQAIMP